MEGTATAHAAVLGAMPGNPRRRRRSALSLLASGLTILAAIPITLVAQSRMATPVLASSSSSIASLSSGAYYTLALKSDGTVWAWGINANGELGNNTSTNRNSPVQVLGVGGVGKLTGVIAVSGSNADSLALKSDGTVWAWGWDHDGELGNGT